MVDIQTLSQKLQIGFTIAVDRDGFTLPGEQGRDIIVQNRRLKSATLWHAKPHTAVDALPSIHGVQFSPPLIVNHGFQAAFGKGFANWLLDLLGAKLEIRAYQHAPNEDVCICYTGVLFGCCRWERAERPCSIDFIPDTLMIGDGDAGYESETDTAVAAVQVAAKAVVDAAVQAVAKQSQVAGLEEYPMTADDAAKINATLDMDASTRALAIAQVKRFPQPVTSVKLERLVYLISGNLGNNELSNQCAVNAVTAVLRLHQDNLLSASAADAGLAFYTLFFELHDQLPAVLHTYRRVVVGRSLPVEMALKLMQKLKVGHTMNVHQYIKPFDGDVPDEPYLTHLS